MDGTTNKNECSKEQQSKEDEQNLSKEPKKIKKLNKLIESLEDELKKTKLQSEKNSNLYLRAMADADNARKRAQKDIENTKNFVLEDFFKDLLTILDSFDKVVDTTEIDKKGVLLVRKQLLSLGEKNGLKAIESISTPFDPNLHNAIQKEESLEVEVETVSQEFAKGYKFKNKLLRAAMVCVATKKEDDTQEKK